MSLTIQSPSNATSVRRIVRDHADGEAPPTLRSRVYLPACAIAVSAIGLIAVGWATHWGGASLTDSMAGLRIVIIGPATLAILAILLVAERVWPAQDRPLLARGHRQDVLYTILNMTLTVPFVAVLSLSFADVVRARLPWLTFPRIGALPHGLVIAAILVAMDGCNWLAHLANHRVQVLWRFHELHHSQEDMTVLTVFRTHPFVHFVYLIALLPGIVLLANGALPTAMLVVYAGWVALAHSNIRLGFGPLGRVFVSPNYHRIHHRLEGRQDVNLGFALSIWDQLFHAAIFPTSQTVAIDTGLKGRPLIVEHGTPRPRHLLVLLCQLVAPFRPMDEHQSPLPPWSSSSQDAKP
jgi:sterol desaturase/sphingolipid hydroxylase (fatty acid hydroxylase superfamily)